jgi:hypothetical protein
LGSLKRVTETFHVFVRGFFFLYPPLALLRSKRIVFNFPDHYPLTELRSSRFDCFSVAFLRIASGPDKSGNTTEKVQEAPRHHTVGLTDTNSCHLSQSRHELAVQVVDDSDVSLPLDEAAFQRDAMAQAHVMFERLGGGAAAFADVAG